MPTRRRQRSDAEDRAAVIAALEAEPHRSFRAREFKDIVGVPKNRVRRAVTVNGDGVTGIPGVIVKKDGDHFLFAKSSGVVPRIDRPAPDFQRDSSVAQPSLFSPATSRNEG